MIYHRPRTKSIKSIKFSKPRKNLFSGSPFNDLFRSKKFLTFKFKRYQYKKLEQIRSQILLSCITKLHILIKLLLNLLEFIYEVM